MERLRVRPRRDAESQSGRTLSREPDYAGINPRHLYEPLA